MFIHVSFNVTADVVYNNNSNNNNSFCTVLYKKKLQIELNEYMSDWAPEITMAANLVGCPLYKVLICKTNNQRYMEEKQYWQSK